MLPCLVSLQQKHRFFSKQPFNQLYDLSRRILQREEDWPERLKWRETGLNPPSFIDYRVWEAKQNLGEDRLRARIFADAHLPYYDGQMMFLQLDGPSFNLAFRYGIQAQELHWEQEGLDAYAPALEQALKDWA